MLNYFERKVEAISFLLGKYGQYLVHHLYEEHDGSGNGYDSHNLKSEPQPELTSQTL